MSSVYHVCLSVCPSVRPPSVRPSVSLLFHPSVRLPSHPSVRPSAVRPSALMPSRVSCRPSRSMPVRSPTAHQQASGPAPTSPTAHQQAGGPAPTSPTAHQQAGGPAPTSPSETAKKHHQRSRSDATGKQPNTDQGAIQSTSMVKKLLDILAWATTLTRFYYMSGKIIGENRQKFVLNIAAIYLIFASGDWAILNKIVSTSISSSMKSPYLRPNYRAAGHVRVKIFHLSTFILFYIYFYFLSIIVSSDFREGNTNKL